MKRRNKYNATKIKIDGYLFDSILEAGWYERLKLYQTAGIITDMVIKPIVKFACGITWKIDYAVIINKQKCHIEVKGKVTAEYKLKLKLYKYESKSPLLVIGKDKNGYKLLEAVNCDNFDYGDIIC